MNNPLKKVAEPAECVCNRSDGLFIPSRQVSMLFTAFLTVLFITFLSGYFFGKKYMVEQFVAKVEQDSFADQIYSSLCALSNYEPDELRSLAVEEPLVTAAGDHDESEVKQDALEQTVEAMIEPALESTAVSAVQSTDKQYYAQLIGYGTELAAKKFAYRLSQKAIPAVVKKRISTTPKGKKRTWFQVVTNAHSDRDMLEKLVDRIAKEERLKGIRIVTC